MTHGEHLVGVDFNPGKHEAVDELKSRTAWLIDYLYNFGGDERCRTVAIERFEEACMWAVKAVTKKARE